MNRFHVTNAFGRGVFIDTNAMSGRWVAIGFSVFFIYGTYDAYINGYPYVPYLALVCLALLPLFFIKKRLSVYLNKGDSYVVEADVRFLEFDLWSVSRHRWSNTNFLLKTKRSSRLRPRKYDVSLIDSSGVIVVALGILSRKQVALIENALGLEISEEE